MRAVLLSLVLAAPAAASDFAVLPCNLRIDGSNWAPGLRVVFPGERFDHPPGEDGLTRWIATDPARAVAWIRARYPQRTANARGLYYDGCGHRSDDDDDGSNDDI